MSSTALTVLCRFVRVLAATSLLAGLAMASAIDAGDDRLLAQRLDSVEPIRIPYAPTVPPGEWTVSRPLGGEFMGRLGLAPLEHEAERLLRIERYRPSPAAPRDSLDAAGARQQRAALRAAALFEAAQDWQGARFAYERAISLGTDELECWRGLGRARLLSGDGSAAEAAYLAALTLLNKTEDPIAFVELRAKIHQDLGKIYLLEGRRRDAQIALAEAEGLAPSDRTVAEWLERSRFPIDFAAPPRAHASPPIWPEPRSVGWLARVETVAQEVQGFLPPQVRDAIAAGMDWVGTGARRRTLATIASVLLAFLVLLRLMRQRGDLSVAVQYPEELRGVFRVRVATSKARWSRPSQNVRSAILKGGVSTRHEHHLVNRETHFRRLLARRYYVTVEGLLMDPDTEEVLADVRDKKVARVRHRRTVRLEYDANPDKCPVDVRVLWDDKPAEDVSVVARGVADSLRRGNGSSVRLFLKKGVHRLVVGCGDRVVVREVDVNSFQPTRVEIDLAGGEVVFKGCPPAVDPYLRGDIETVAQALERDGQAERAYLMLAQLNRERGEVQRAADYFESAGRHLEAAELRAGLGDYGRAATLYMQAEEPLKAAEMHKQANDLVQAGQAYEEALDFDRAIECYREARAVGKWINALERRGETFRAAKIALEHEQRPRAIRLLQCIAPEDSDYAEASWLLAAAFEREGHWDLAAQKLEQHIATYRPGTAPADKYARLADLLEHAGSVERALEVLEDLRQREPTYPNVASRIELLRKQRSAADRLARSSIGGSGSEAATAFVAEYRYEILEEIGRGGMGVVFKARDRRLDRIVALKRLPEDLRRHHPRAVQLFLREAQAAARLNHSNIVTVYDTDQEDGNFFITMELLDGEPFHRILKEKGRLSPASAVNVGLQVAAGLQYAHAQGIVHRDIKTANLFLTTDKLVKIMDFGLAKMFEEVRGGTTVISGTPFYMSPEQVVGGVVDQRTDLYSLGVTLFELATGSVPFSQGDIAYHHRHTPPPDPRDLAVDIPDSLAELVLDLLAKDVGERCPSAGELCLRLESIKRSPSSTG